jgi:hypothetical protein
MNDRFDSNGDYTGNDEDSLANAAGVLLLAPRGRGSVHWRHFHSRDHRPLQVRRVNVLADSSIQRVIDEIFSLYTAAWSLLSSLCACLLELSTACSFYSATKGRLGSAYAPYWFTGVNPTGSNAPSYISLPCTASPWHGLTCSTGTAAACTIQQMNLQASLNAYMCHLPN